METLECRVVPAVYNFNSAASTLIINLETDESLTVTEDGTNTTFTLSTGSFTAVGDPADSSTATSITFADGELATSLVIDDSLATDPSTNNVSFDSGTVTSATITVALNVPGADTIAFNGGALGSSGTVTLTSGFGDITSPGGASADVTANTLSLFASSGIGSNADPITTSVTNLSATTATGGVFISNTGGPLIVTGASAVISGDVSITTDGTGVPVGNLTVSGPVSAAGGNVLLQNIDADDLVTLNVNSTVTAGGDVMILGEDAVSVTAAVSGGGNVTITADADNGAGAAGDLTTSGIGTISSSGGSINLAASDDVSIGAAVSVTGGSGGITATADSDSSGAGEFTSSSGGTLSTTAGAIGVSGVNVTVGDTVSSTSGGVTATAAGGALAANASITTGGSVALAADGDLSVTAAVSGDTGVSATANADSSGGGDFTSTAGGTLSTTTGSITVSGTAVTIGDTVGSTGGGAINLNATTAVGGDLLINAAVSASGGNGNVTLAADNDVSVNAAVSAAGTGNVSITADFDDSGAGDITSNAAGTIDTAGGTISIGGNPSAVAQNVTLGGAVTVTGGSGGISVQAENNAGVNAALQVTGSGNISISADSDSSGAGDFTSSSGGTLSTTTGAVGVSGVNVTIGDTVSSTGGGAINLDATTAVGGDLLINAAVSASGGNGNVTLAADNDVSVNAAVSAAGTGIVSITADSDSDGVGAFSSNAAGTINTAGGTISIAAAGTVTLGGAVTVTGGSGGIGVSSGNDVLVNAAVTINGGGSGNVFIAADSDNSGAGDITSNAAGTINTAGGNVILGGGLSAVAQNVTVGGAVTVTGGSGGIFVSADNNVLVNAALQVTGSGTVFLTGDIDDSGAGDITSNAAGTIDTAGGSVTIGGSLSGVAQNVTLGGAVTVTGGSGGISVQAENNANVNAALQVTGGGSGGITVAAASNNSGAGDFTSSAGGTLSTTTGAIGVSGVNVTVGDTVSSTSGNVTAAAAGGTAMVNAAITTGTGTIAISTTDSAAGGENLTVNAAVSSTSGNIGLSAGDNISVNGTLATGGAGVITLTGDTGGAVDAAGTVITIGSATALTAATAVNLVGNAGGDTFNVIPQSNGTQLAVAGAAPGTVPGDILGITGDTGTALSLTGVDANGKNGKLTFSNGGTVMFTGIDTFSTATPFALVLDLAALGFGNGSAAPDQVNVSTTAGGVLNVTVQNNSTGTPVSIFSGLASNVDPVAGITINGSNDSERFTIDETNPGIPVGFFNGGGQTSGPGDSLFVNTTNATNVGFTSNGPGAGKYTFGNRKDVNFTGMDVGVPNVISIVATDDAASERGADEAPDTATFTLTRSGDLTAALTVNYAITGTAVNGRDYETIAVTAFFAAGSPTAVVTINPLNNSLIDGTRTVTVTLAPGAGYFLATGAAATATATIADNDSVNRRYMSAAPTGGLVTAADPATGASATFAPFPGFTGAVSVAVGDVNGDGVTDFAFVGGIGGPSVVEVFDGATGALRLVLPILGGTYLGGVSLSIGDVDGDGRGEIVVGLMTGLPAVGVFDGLTGGLRTAFLAYAAPVGVNVAVGDLDGDGKAEIVVTPTGVAPLVSIFDGDGNLKSSFFAFSPTLGSVGLTVAVGDLDGDGKAEIIAGAFLGAGNPIQGTFLLTYNADGSLRQGLILPTLPQTPMSSLGPPVSSADVNGDGASDILVTDGPFLGILDGKTFALLGVTMA